MKNKIRFNCCFLAEFVVLFPSNNSTLQAATRAVKLKCYLCAEFLQQEFNCDLTCPGGTVVCFRPAWTENKYVTLRYSGHDYNPGRANKHLMRWVSPRNWLILSLICWPRWPLGGGATPSVVTYLPDGLVKTKHKSRPTDKATTRQIFT